MRIKIIAQTERLILRPFDIGFRLARSFWFRGYATEAAVAVRDYASHTLYLPRLIALIDPENTASNTRQR